MAKTYKIWAYIEEYNDKTDKYKDIDEPLAIGFYDNLKDARDYVLDEHDVYMSKIIINSTGRSNYDESITNAWMKSLAEDEKKRQERERELEEKERETNIK